MTPEERVQLAEVYQWMQERKLQQISAPLDEASRNSLGAAVDRGAGATTTTQLITIGSGGGSATVPANPIGTRLFEADGVRYEIPYLSTS